MARVRSMDGEGSGRRGKAGLFALLALLGIVVVLIAGAVMESGGGVEGSERAERASGRESGGGGVVGDGGRSSGADGARAGGDRPVAGDDGVEGEVEAGGGDGSGEVAPASFEVEIAGERFVLDTALTPVQRTLGLSFRDEIAADGGMVFAFRRASMKAFVMRDCLVPIDILYLRDDGTVINTHAMEVEPRREGESDFRYESRLRRYRSGAPTRLVVELAGGTIERLGIGRGDRVVGDFERLFRYAAPDPVIGR